MTSPTNDTGERPATSTGGFAWGFVAVAAFIMLLRWRGSGVGLLDTFIWGRQWLSTVMVLASAGFAGWLASEIQPTWERDGGWSPRTLGYVLGTVAFISIALIMYRNGF